MWWLVVGIVMVILLIWLEGDKEYFESSSRDIRIIVPPGSLGTLTDAHIYQSILPNSRIVYSNSTDERDKHSDVNLYIEELFGVKERLFPSNKKWTMINQDVTTLDDVAAFDEIDVFLCKSRYAERLLNDYIQRYNLKGKVVYTRHTSNEVEYASPKDYNLFVHFAGKSWLKNTKSIVDAWIQAEGFRDLDYPKLVITCRDSCLNPLKELLTQFRVHREGEWVHKSYSNIRIFEKLPQEEYENLQKTAGFYICPSELEGYGHYLNEGRSAGAVVLTTDFPPMNELIDSHNGVLIKPDGFEQYGVREGKMKEVTSCIVSPESIIRAVRIAKSLSEVSLVKMGHISRQRYLDEEAFLKKELLKLV